MKTLCNAMPETIEQGEAANASSAKSKESYWNQRDNGKHTGIINSMYPHDKWANLFDWTDYDGIYEFTSKMLENANLSSIQQK